MKSLKFNNRITFTLSVFLISKLIVFGVVYCFGYNKFWGTCFAHWDSNLYISIAQEGHTLFDCSNIDQLQWCGNAGWMPLYPLLMRLLNNITHTSMEESGLVVTMFFYVLYIWYLLRLFEFQTITKDSFVSLMLGVFFPGFIYLHAVFPMSLCLFLITAILYYLQNQKFIYVGILSMFLIWAYASGFFIFIPILFYCFGLYFFEKKLTPKIAATLFLPILLAIVLLFAYDNWVTGHWNAMFLIQQKYGHGLKLPWEMLNARFCLLLKNIGNALGIIQIQIFFVFSIIVWISIILMKKLSKINENKPISLFCLGFIVAFWILPFSMGIEISLYRGSILLSILIIFWQNKTLDFKIIMLIAFSIFIIPMIAYFLNNTMI